MSSRMVAARWQSAVLIDLDGTVMRGPFESAVFPIVTRELAAKSGRPAAEIRTLALQENLRRQHDPHVPAVLAMDWDDILRTVAAQLGVCLEASALEIVRSHAGPPYAVVLEQADAVLRRLAAPGRALVAASKGLARYQLPVLEALGLRGLFDDVLTPESSGALKCDVAFFRPWLVQARLVVMVGDTYEDDVLAPHHFGLRTVWKLGVAGDAVRGMDPFARPLAYHYDEGQMVPPDAIIVSLAELPGVIERLEAQ